jgi:hypothetical protein
MFATTKHAAVNSDTAGFPMEDSALKFGGVF